jgi:hypothetical protein
MARGAFKGRSSSLRRYIKKYLGLVIKQSEMPNQAHHALSSSEILKLEVDPEYQQNLAENSGYDINNANNGILMPARYGHQKRMKLQRHEGGHSEDYYLQVERILVPIYGAYQQMDPCTDSEGKEDLLADLRDAENDAKQQIKELNWELYARSKELYEEDYKDEGQGELSMSHQERPRDTSRASGLGWLDVEAKDNNIRRRYRIVDGKEEVNTEFYDTYGYPYPSNLKNPRK